MSTKIERLPFEMLYCKGKSKMRSTGRSKGNISLPIFKNEPMDRNNEYTYKVWRLANAKA